MATYKISDVQERLFELRNDGFLYADISELDGDDEDPTCLYFSGLQPYEEVDYEEVYSIPDVSDHDLTHYTISPEANCHGLIFTYAELDTLHHALLNALEYCKECEKDPSYSRETLREIKASSVSFRNLEAKMTKFYKQHIH